MRASGARRAREWSAGLRPASTAERRSKPHRPNPREATRRQGNADLWSAQAAAGGRQRRTPSAGGMVRLRPGQSDAQARERRPLVGTGRRRRPADKDPDCGGDGSASPGAERRAGKGTPTSGRHRPPQAAGRQGPRLRGGWFGFARSRTTRRQGNADLRSAQAAAGGRQRRTPTAGGMVGLQPGQSDAQARERRPLVGTGRRRRPADKDPDCGDGSASAGAERRAGKGTPTSGRHRPPQAAGREGPRVRGDGSASPGAERRAGKGTPTSGRHRPPQAAGREGPRLRGDGSASTGACQVTHENPL